MRTANRYAHILAVSICVALLTIALYLQYYADLSPCPLCIISRLIVMAIALTHFIALIHRPVKKSIAYIYNFLSGFLSIAGIGLSVRHVWIQHLPSDQAPACGPSLDYLLQTLPFTEMLQTVLSGDGECAKVDWSMWGMSLPEWMIIFFIFLFIVNLYSAIKK